MNLRCQSSAIEELDELAKCRRHSIIIEGDSGSGKTYLSKYYANQLGISNYVSISPTVESVRSMVANCLSISTPIVVCVENLESGVAAASHALLKFLEEPTDNSYIVVTATRCQQLLDTIVSRSSIVTVGHPVEQDLIIYATQQDSAKYNKYSKSLIWKAVRTFSDIRTVFGLSDTQILYLESIPKLLLSKEPISNLVWQFGHFDNNAELPIRIALQLIIATTQSQHIRKSAIECLDDISFGRIANHACLTKFFFEAKYCE